MKTAISIPDNVFDAAEKFAYKMGMSRSELYVNAVREYVEKYTTEDVTDKLNEVYSSKSVDASLDEVLQRMQSASLPRDECNGTSRGDLVG